MIFVIGQYLQHDRSSLGVSLIAGMKYGMKYGMNGGMEMEQNGEYVTGTVLQG